MNVREYLGFCAIALLLQTACDALCPDRRTGTVLGESGTVEAGEVKAFEVTSPTHSNLFIVARWGGEAELQLRVFDVDCSNIRSACPQEAFGSPSGAGNRLDVLVDGQRGRRWGIEVIGDPSASADFTLEVTFDTGTCT